MNEKQMLGTLLIKTSTSSEWTSQDISIKDGIFLVGSFVLPLPTAFLRVLPPGGNACPSPYAFEILTERGESFVLCTKNEDELDCWVNSILSLGNPPQHKLARRVSSSNRIAKELSWVNIIEIVFVITLLNLLLILILYSDPAHVESWVFVGMINVLVGYAVTKQEFKQGMVSTTAVQKDEFETNSAEGEEEDDESPSSSLLHIMPSLPLQHLDPSFAFHSLLTLSTEPGLNRITCTDDHPSLKCVGCDVDVGDALSPLLFRSDDLLPVDFVIEFVCRIPRSNAGLLSESAPLELKPFLLSLCFQPQNRDDVLHEELLLHKGVDMVISLDSTSVLSYLQQGYTHVIQGGTRREGKTDTGRTVDVFSYMVDVRTWSLLNRYRINALVGNVSTLRENTLGIAFEVKRTNSRGDALPIKTCLVFHGIDLDAICSASSQLLTK